MRLSFNRISDVPYSRAVNDVRCVRRNVLSSHSQYCSLSRSGYFCVGHCDGNDNRWSFEELLPRSRSFCCFRVRTKWQKRSISVAKCLCLYGEQRYVVQSEHHSCAAKSVSLVKSSYLCKTACFPRHLDGQSLWCIHSLRNGYAFLGTGVGQSGCGCGLCLWVR